MGEWGIAAIYNYHMNKESKEMKEQEQDQFSRMESYHQKAPKERQSIFKMCDILYDMIDDALDPEHSTQEEDVLAYVQQNIEPKLDAFVYVIKEKEARSKALLEDVKVKREEAQTLKNAAERIKNMMIETLEHVADWRMALSAIHAMLKDGGSLIMSARNAKADLRRWKDLHEREWTGTQLLDNLMQFFGPRVYLFDYSLQDNLERHTRTTPLIAIATK